MAELPHGTVTLLFTDIEGSTRLLRSLGDRYAEALADHRRIIREACSARDGVEVDTQGDAFFVSFPTARDAVLAAAAAQRALAAHSWPDGQELRVRMGIHTGEPALTGEGYVGLDLHEGARIASAGHGGQILVSETTKQLLSDVDLPGLTLLELGEHRLKDLTSAKHLFQVAGEGLEGTFPPLKSLDHHPIHLPVQPTPMLGRQAELEAVAACLAGSRLVTLTGPGGTGKTRLALQAAADSADRFPDGVFLVDLSSVTEPELVGPAIAQTVGVREGAGRTVVEGLKALWADRQVLLVVDNFEHLAPAAPVLGDLMSGCPRLRVLVTSRQPLRLPGEQEYDVPPLPTSEAADLFAARARAVRADLVLSDDDREVVAEICARLDGLPLAIELAAARIKVLTPRALAARLGHSLDLLTRGAAGAPPRQQTLRGAIEWSYSLLSEPEQRLFRRLTVFDTCTLSAAEEVLGPDAGVDVLDGLDSLVAHSLVRRLDLGSEPRFAMLATIREYAAEQLERDSDRDRVRDRHADHVLEIASVRARRRRVSDGAQNWMARLESEHGNVRLALVWMLDRGRFDDATRLVDHCWRGWFTYGRIREGAALCREVIARATGAEPVALAWATTMAGEFERFSGNPEEARRLKEIALPVLRDGRPLAAAATLDDLGDIAADQGRYADSRALHEEAARIFAEVGEAEAEAHPRAGLGRLCLITGEWQEAREHYEFVLAFGRSIDDVDYLAESLTALAILELQEGSLDRARALTQEALLMLTRQPDVGFVAELLPVVAGLVAQQGRWQQAAQLLGATEGLMMTGGFVLYFPDRRDALATTLRRALGHEALGRAVAEGRGMTHEQATSYALGQLEK